MIKYSKMILFKLMEVYTMRVIFAKDVKAYMAGKCDGIIFQGVTPEDKEILANLASKYNKEIQVMEDIISTYNPDSNEEEPQQLVASKKKKVWVNNGSEAHKINEDELKDYLAKGYKIGKKK